jgi:hypothetical protein
MIGLTGEITLHDAAFVLDYVGENHSDETVFAANAVRHARFDPATPGSLRLHPNAAYVSLSADGREVRLLIGTSPLPNEREVEFGVAPPFLRIAPRTIFAGRVLLSLPLAEWDAYHPPAEKPGVDVVLKRELVLSVEYILESAALRVKPSQSPADHWEVGGTSAFASLRLTADSPVAIARRHDTGFDRV